MVPVYTISLPQYSVENEPNHDDIGSIVDKELMKHYLGQTVAARGVSMDAHDISPEELIRKIQTTGTDRYDPTRLGDRYENVQNKPIDFFAFRRKVTKRMKLFRDISWGFYHGGKSVHGVPIRIDILSVYDPAKLKAVLHQYDGRTDKKRDGFIFKDPANKTEALLGIIVITR